MSAILRHMAIGLVTIAVSTGAAIAQNYPTKPIRIVTSGIGGGADVVSRLLEVPLATALQQRIVVDNRSTGSVPGEIVMHASPDGYTLLLFAGTLWTESLFQKTPYDALRDFAPVTQLTRSPNIIVVTPSLPVHSVADLIGLAKAKPGALNYATGGTGAANHIAAEIFKSMVGVDMVRVPYKNGTLQATDLISGRVQLMFASISMMPHIKSGKLRAIAVTSATPSEVFPGLPTVASSGLKGYESGSIYALFAPAKTPAPIVRKLSGDTARVLQSADMKQKFLTAGMETVGNTPEELAAVVRSEVERLRKIVPQIKD